MAKVSFTKLGLKVNQEVATIEINEQTIEVKQYLPINDKLELISRVINLSHDENNFANPVKVSIFTVLEMIYAYTNINFTDKQKEDPAKLYDVLTSSGFVSMVIGAIPETERHDIIEGVSKSIEAIYSYRNSVMGILDTISTDYDNLNLDVNNIYTKLADPNNMDLLRQVLTKLG